MLLAPSKIAETWKRWDSGSRQRYSAYWQSIAQADPTLSRVYVTVELVFGDGSTIRLARAPITTTSGKSGDVYAWSQGLIEEPSVSSDVQVGSQSAGARSVSLSLPAGLVDANAILANGGILAGIGEVCWQVDGGDYDKRLVLLRGDISGGVAFGTTTEQMQIRISDARLTSSLLVPQTVLDTTRWDEAGEDAIGKRYPLVLNGYPYIPCIRVISSTPHPTYLICEDGRDMQINAMYQNGTSAPAYTETDTNDLLGTQVLNAAFTAGTWVDTDSVYADISLVDTARSMSAIQTIEALLRGYTSMGINALNPEMFGIADAAMPGYAPKILINASGEATVNILEFVESSLLPTFPMIHMAYDGRGLGPVVIDHRQEASAVMEAGVDLIERLSLYTEVSKEDLYTSYSLRYNFNAMNNEWGGAIARDTHTDGACSVTRDRIGGERPYSPIDATWIFTDQLANYVLDWLVDHYSRAAYDVQWTVLPATLFRLRLGMNITYTDAAFSVFTARKATVLGLTWVRGKPSVILRVWL